MSETLVLRLYSTDKDYAEWICVDGDGARVTALANGSLEHAREAAIGRTVCVLLRINGLKRSSWCSSCT